MEIDMRYLVLFLSVLFFTGCSTTAPESTTALEKPESSKKTVSAIPEPQDLPGELKFIGDPAAGDQKDTGSSG